MSGQAREPHQLLMWARDEEAERHDEDRVEEERIIQQALGILESRCMSGEAMRNPPAVAEFLRLKLGDLKNECFAVLYLNGRHELLAYREHFHGTIDCASVYPRVIVQTALEVNAASVIFGHNHPSGIPEPSEADRQITRKLITALAMFDVRVLDHVVVSIKGAVSFAERAIL